MKSSNATYTVMWRLKVSAYGVCPISAHQIRTRRRKSNLGASQSVGLILSRGFSDIAEFLTRSQSTSGTQSRYQGAGASRPLLG
jgi:hypothetical protein